MTEKFKTKYHALAWAAEDENNVFVDGNDDYVKIDNGGTVYAVQGSDYHALNVSDVMEPCHKLEVEKSNEESVYDNLHTIWQDSGSLKMLQVLFDECDNRYARKK